MSGRVAFEVLRREGALVVVRPRHGAKMRSIGVPDDLDVLRERDAGRVHFEPALARALGLWEGREVRKMVEPCEACGTPCAIWADIGHRLVRPGAGAVENAQVWVPDAWACSRDKRGARRTSMVTRPMWACSDECERAILSGLGRSPAGAGLRPTLAVGVLYVDRRGVRTWAFLAAPEHEPRDVAWLTTDRAQAATFDTFAGAGSRVSAADHVAAKRRKEVRVVDFDNPDRPLAELFAAFGVVKGRR